MSNLLRRCWLAPLLFAFCTPAQALQESEVSESTVQVTAAGVDPRGVITDFLAGMKAYTLSEFLDASQQERALSSFGSAAKRQDAGKLAQMLYTVLNRTALVDPNDFLTAGDPGLAEGRWIWSKYPPSEPDLEIELIFTKQSGGGALSVET